MPYDIGFAGPGSGPATRVHPLGELGNYRYSTIFARHWDRWLLCRHRERDTYETAGGHIEPGETPLQAARRELFEETGALEYDITPLFDYAVHTAGELSCGQVFFARVLELGELPEGSEMREVRLFEALPPNVTYPAIYSVVFEEVEALRTAKSLL